MHSLRKAKITSGSMQVRRWRDKIKAATKKSMGGSCQICGYDRCKSALELHHIDPSAKETSFTRTAISEERLLAELRKCVLLCANCHREVHEGLVESPQVSSFDEAVYFEAKKNSGHTDPSRNVKGKFLPKLLSEAEGAPRKL